MRRGVLVAVILVAIVGGVIALAGRTSERPLTRVEKTVPDNALAH